MTSRGIIIGRIIDDLSSLTEKIEFRAKLGLFDIHRVLENFVKDILQIIFDASDIDNLNATRSNAPGLDLGSDLLKTGYQVSSKVDSAKLNSSFEKIADNYADKYELIKFIVIGKKQKSYRTFDSSKIPANIAFDTDVDVLDFGDLSKLIFDLIVEKLLLINQLFDKEFLVVRYHISEPDFETESTVQLFVTNEFRSAKNGLLFFGSDKDEDALKRINNEGQQLSNLPLRTRRILMYIIENGKESGTSVENQFDTRYYLIPKLKREINLPEKEVEQELNILIDENFLGVEQMELDGDIHVPETAVYTRFGEFFKYLITYSIENKILKEIVLNLNLEAIDED